MAAHKKPDTIRKANNWLKRVGAVQFEFSSNQNILNNTIYNFIKLREDEHRIVIYASTSLNECIDYVCRHYKGIKDWN